jgi:hypothetical protein
MAREIDTSNPEKLSFEERLYLQDRNQLPKGLEPITAEDIEESKNTDVDDADLEDLPYAEWPKKALVAEAKARKANGADIITSGSIPDLADALTAHDAASEEA